MDEIEKEMQRVRLRDELAAIEVMNSTPYQDYETNVRHRARANIRRKQILAELTVLGY